MATSREWWQRVLNQHVAGASFASRKGSQAESGGSGFCCGEHPDVLSQCYALGSMFFSDRSEE